MNGDGFTRRQWLGASAGLAVSALGITTWTRRPSARLDITLRRPTRSVPAGSHALGLRREKDGLVLVPSSVKSGTPTPVLVMLHGAGGAADRIATRFPMVDEAGIVLVVPSSRGPTWDGIQGSFGTDVTFIRNALEWTIDRIDVDPRHFGVAGFSDGASYGLSLGLANGDLFSHVIAFSPGFIPPAEQHGKPPIYIAHGTADTILPIAQTSRRIVPRLKREGYEVEYREFDGPHTVDPGIARAAFAWFTGV